MIYNINDVIRFENECEQKEKKFSIEDAADQA